MPAKPPPTPPPKPLTKSAEECEQVVRALSFRLRDAALAGADDRELQSWVDLLNLAERLRHEAAGAR